MSDAPPPLPSTPGRFPGAARWANAFFLLLIVALCIETYLSLGVAPRFARMFEEMIGPLSHLPAIARAVVTVTRWQQSNILLLALPVLGCLGYLLAQRRKLWVRLTCGVLATLLLAYTAVGYVGLQMPAVQLIQSIGEPARP